MNPTTIDLRSVAQPPVNGREPELSIAVPTAEFKVTDDHAPAKVNKVARGWRERRQERRATRTASDHADEQDWTRWYPALIWLAVGVVVVTFALSYHGLFEFANNIAHLPWGLAVVVPIGIDVFSLCCLVATFLCRGAHWRVRVYSWSMFLVTVAVSVAGNAMYAVSEVQDRANLELSEIRWGYLQYGAVVGAALWPAFSAGALHLLIVARRHLAAQRATARTVAQQAEREEAAEALNRARAIELVAAGQGCPAIADQLGVPRRTVERWTAEIRAAMTPPTRTAPAPSARRK